MFPNVCCPSGYSYNGTVNMCIHNVAPTDYVAPIPCKCCPPGPAGQNYTYFSDTGWFYNLYTGSVMQVTGWTGGPVTDLYNKCASTQASPMAYGPAFDPVDCPCCPKTFSYDPSKGTCLDSTGSRATDPIPCIVCVCPTPTPFTCPTPESGAEGIRPQFQFNPNTRHCTACVPEGSNPPKGKINCFIPNTLIDPSTTGFVLKQH